MQEYTLVSIKHILAGLRPRAGQKILEKLHDTYLKGVIRKMRVFITIYSGDTICRFRHSNNLKFDYGTPLLVPIVA